MTFRSIAQCCTYAILLMLSFITFCAFPLNYAVADEPVGGVADSLSSMMESRGCGVLVSSDILLDRYGEPSYVIGYSEEGYLIMDLSSYAFLEQGVGDGPYSADAEKKYYGGVGCYTEDFGTGLVDAMTDRPVDAISFLPAVETVTEENGTRNRSSGRMGASAVVNVKYIDDYKTDIQNVLFGKNGADLNNTCTAVATTIALNYLDQKFDWRLVLSEFELEQWTGAREKNISYSQASSFHRYLVEECGFNLRDFPVLETLGVWGDQAKEGFYAYLGNDSDRQKIGVDFSWDLAGGSLISSSIDNNCPVLITTLIDWWNEAPVDANYGNHTMVVYGYRTLEDGSMEINVHSGWYASASHYEDDDSKLVYMPDIWVPSSLAFMTYNFSLSDGWHYGEDGSWRYFENGTYCRGWKDINGFRYYFGVEGSRTIGYLTQNGVRYYFNNDGILISQSSIGSASTGGSVEDMFIQFDAALKRVS